MVIVELTQNYINRIYFNYTIKITATKNQHSEIVKYIKLGMVECDLNNGTIILLNYRGEDTSFNCNTDPGVWRKA